MKLQSNFLLFFILFGCGIVVHAQELKNIEYAKIHTETDYLLRLYQKRMNEIAKSHQKRKSTTKYTNDVLELFLNRNVQVFNDIDPNGKLSKSYEIETYLSNLNLWYPDGIPVQLDFSKAKSPGVFFHKDNIWFMDIAIPKKMTGNYMDRQMHNFNKVLVFRIAFTKKRQRYNKFKIVGIRDLNSVNSTVKNDDLSVLNKAAYAKNDFETIKQNATSLLLDYERAFQLIGSSDISTEEKTYFSEDLKTLFQSGEVQVYNDLVEKSTDKFISINEYIKIYKEDYPNSVSGFSINSDSMNFGNVEEIDKEYRISVVANKFFSGIYHGEQKQVYSGDQIFTITFREEDGDYIDFSIKGIDLNYKDFDGVNSKKIQSIKNAANVKPIRRVGSIITLSSYNGISNIKSQNIINQTMASELNEWEITPHFTQAYSILYYKYKTNHFGYYTGLGISSYETSYSLTGNFAGELTTDINDDDFIPRVDASIDSAVSLNYISVPLGIEVDIDIKKQVAFYFNTGLVLSARYSSEYTLTGDYYEYYGYYPEHDQKMQELHIEELGFYSEHNIFRKNSADVNLLNVSGFISIGAVIKTGYFTAFKIGPYLNRGLFSVQKGEVYQNIFNKKFEFKPVKLNHTGLEVSFVLQF